MTQRQPIMQRYDLLDPDFLDDMARVAHIGAHKYGERSYQNPAVLKGDADPINHALRHINQYQRYIPNDHGHSRSFHLAQAAFNLMMEYYHARQAELQELQESPKENPVSLSPTLSESTRQYQEEPYPPIHPQS